MGELALVGVLIAVAILVAGWWIASAIRAWPAVPPPGATGHKSARDLVSGDEILIAPMVDGAWWTVELERLRPPHGWRKIAVKDRLMSGIIHLECVDGIQVAEASPGRRVWIRRSTGAE
jgi:hypothetical protein